MTDEIYQVPNESVVVVVVAVVVYVLVVVVVVVVVVVFAVTAAAHRVFRRFFSSKSVGTSVTVIEDVGVSDVDPGINVVCLESKKQSIRKRGLRPAQYTGSEQVEAHGARRPVPFRERERRREHPHAHRRRGRSGKINQTSFSGQTRSKGGVHALEDPLCPNVTPYRGRPRGPRGRRGRHGVGVALSTAAVGPPAAASPTGGSCFPSLEHPRRKLRVVQYRQ